MRMSELADLVVQSRSRLTHTATRLEKRGWVVREPCQGDRRGSAAHAHDHRCRAKVEQIAPVHLDQVRAHLVDRLTAAAVRDAGRMPWSTSCGPRRRACETADGRSAQRPPAGGLLRPTVSAGRMGPCPLRSRPSSTSCATARFTTPTGVLYGRLPGFHLSDLGHAMATEVRDHLAAHDIVHVVSSPLERPSRPPGRRPTVTVWASTSTVG
jgi:hypothetical protein